MSESLKGKVAVISGVGSGFAKATAELFAKKDKVSLVMFDIDEAGLSPPPRRAKPPGPRWCHSRGTLRSPRPSRGP